LSLLDLPLLQRLICFGTFFLLAGFSVKRGESQNFAGRFGVGSRILKRLKGITIPGKEINMQNPKATEEKVLWKSV